MAYGRFNYVCQPEDKVKQLIPVIGPYDDFAISWGYKPIAGAKTSEAERATLDKWAARQLEEPWLRFGGEDGPAAVDPTVKTENIGDDSLKATELGLEEPRPRSRSPGGRHHYAGLRFHPFGGGLQGDLTHRRNWFNAISLNVGGVQENRTLGGRGTESFTRVTKERQREAVHFLLNNALTTPTKLLNPAIVNRFKYNGVASDVQGQQHLGIPAPGREARPPRRLRNRRFAGPARPLATPLYFEAVDDGRVEQLRRRRQGIVEQEVDRFPLSFLRGRA